jgi:hypothetical protein
MAPTTRKIVCFSGTQLKKKKRPLLFLPITHLTTPPFIYIDFDGTIFMQDTGHVLFDNLGCGEARRKILDEQIKSGERSFREVSEEMWDSLRVPFEDGFELLQKELEIDPGFREFHQFCVDNDIDFNVISAGLKPILSRVLDVFLGEEEVCSTLLENHCAVILINGCCIGLPHRNRRQRSRNQTRRLRMEARLAARHRTRSRQSPLRKRRARPSRRRNRG